MITTSTFTVKVLKKQNSHKRNQKVLKEFLLEELLETSSKLLYYFQSIFKKEVKKKSPLSNSHTDMDEYEEMPYFKLHTQSEYSLYNKYEENM